MDTFILDKTNSRVKQVFDLMVTTVRLIAKSAIVEVTVKKHKKSRTGQQNRYYWKLIGLVADHVGQDKEIISDDAMIALGHIEERVVRGKVYTKVRSTTKLTTDEFATLINAAIVLCEQLDIRYPVPADLGMNWD